MRGHQYEVSLESRLSGLKLLLCSLDKLGGLQEDSSIKLDLYCIFVLQWLYIDFAWEVSTRPDVMTRWRNEVKERVGAALSKKTEPSGPLASPNK